MNEERYDEMITQVKNKMMEIGHEITASDSMNLSLKLGKIAYTDDTFNHASLEELMGAFTNFVASYIVAKEEFDNLSEDMKREYIHAFMRRMSLLFAATQIANEEMKKRDKQFNKRCNHLDSLVDYVLNEEYWICIKCKEKVKKNVRKYG